MRRGEADEGGIGGNWQIGDMGQYDRAFHALKAGIDDEDVAGKASFQAGLGGVAGDAAADCGDAARRQQAFQVIAALINDRRAGYRGR